ncbi:MAG: hypothetical protein J6Z14_13625 [Prevotella sp.]|nr:hypothetical protein [Prevotella sp.]
MTLTYILHSSLFVPMHFVASGFKSAWRMKEFTDEKGIPFLEKNQYASHHPDALKNLSK